MMSHRGFRLNCVFSVLALSCAVSLARQCHAQSISWAGGTNGNWNVPANWNPAVVPGSVALDDDVIIAGSPNITMSVSEPHSINSISLTGVLTINAGVTLSTTNATIQSTAQFNGSGTFSVSGAMTTDSSTSTTVNVALNVQTGATVTVNSGALDLQTGLNNGTIIATAAGTKVNVLSGRTYNNGTGAFTGNVDVSGTLQFNSPVSIAPDITVEIGGSLSGSSLVTFTGGSLTMLSGTISTPLQFNGGAGLSMSGNPTFNSTVTANGTNTLSGIATLTINTGATLTFGGTTSVNANNGVMAITGPGNFSNTGTMTNINNSIDITCTGSNSGTMMNNVGNLSSINVKSTFTNSGSIQTSNASAALLIASTGNLIAAPGASFGGQVIDFNVFTVNTTLTFPGVLTLGTAPSFGTSNGSVAGSGSLILSGSMTVGGSSATMGSSIPITLLGTASEPSPTRRLRSRTISSSTAHLRWRGLRRI